MCPLSICLCFSLFFADAQISTAKVEITAETNKVAPPTTTAMVFQQFTGKVMGNKVRERLKADLDSHIVRQFNKGELLLIVGEKENFWEVAPSNDTRFYIFKNFISDNTVSGDRVNFRLLPNTDAPIIGQLENGTKIQGDILASNPKWIAILPPNNVNFYVSKEFIENIGDVTLFNQFAKKKEEGFKRLEAAQIAYENDLKGEAIDSLDRSYSQFMTVAREYSDIPEIIAAADAYLAKINIQKEEKPIVVKNSKPAGRINSALCNTCSEKLWLAVEDGLFLSWKNFHPQKSMSDFYKEQKAHATLLSGVVESYTNHIKSAPGNYLLKGESTPIAYLYSTQVDLKKYMGKKVTVLVSPRQNNNFAFPAYFVNEVKD